MKTFLPKVNEIEHKCYLIDAKDKVLGRVAAKAASILRGKHRRIYTPFLDCGDTVVIINASKVRVTGKKLTDKEWIAIFMEHPILLERPIFIHKDKAIIARPSELVKTIF